MVAALYVERGGPYFGRDDVDPWDRERDARLYNGPHPVVAHPPCGPWGALKHLYQGDEHDCAPRAVDQVRQFGGILEHPAGSRLWERCWLPEPGWADDQWGGYTLEVCRVDWGHPARKRTWLYLVGVPRDELAFPPPRKPTHWASGTRDPKKAGARGLVPPGIKVCSAQQRRRTPPAFADWLIGLASNVQRRAA